MARLTVPLAFAIAALATPQIARALSPESAEVKQSIERALAYLEPNCKEEGRLGAKCLIGLCYLKNGRPVSHALIQAGIQACRDLLKEAPTHNETYSLALAVIYLCELEEQQPQLRDLAQSYLDILIKRQQPGGGWGYLNLQTGDTSQTQYGALAMWMAANHRFQVPQDTVERLCGWLVRTQDPSGTWSYQGTDPGDYRRIAQSAPEQRLSLHVGGIGSLYITADLLGIVQGRQPGADRKLPPALRAVGKAEEERRPGGKLGPLKLFDVQLARSAIADGDKFFTQHYTIEPREQLHYYLYGLERYQSFKELAAGQAEKEPRWYNEGATLLMRTQTQAGGWSASGDNHVTATCFAILFLARSSNKAIAKINPNLGAGILLGGMGLPPNTADLVERDGKVVESPLAGSIDELLAIIEKPNSELDQLIDPRKPIDLDTDVTKRAGQIVRLRALVSAGNFNARLLAVSTLAKSRELDNAPILIYALSDPIDQANPDYRIVLAADRALRFLSRKFSGVGLPPAPKPQEVQSAIAAWKDWYKSVRPDAEFLD